MKFHSPFTLTLDPMERLLLINITADPDEVYVGFEPQVFNDPVNGCGLLVLAYLKDGRVDVYHQPGVSLAGKNYDIVGKGLREQAERPMTGARFDITPTGVDLDIAFDDLLGRPVVLHILEMGGKPTHPFSILAPMGNTVERPPALPLFFLHDFYFVRRANTELLLSVDGRAHKPDSIPMLLDGARVHFLRYGGAPFLVNWNAAFDGEMPSLPVADGAPVVVDGPVRYELAWSGSRPALAAMTITGGGRDLRLAFAPAFPDVVTLVGVGNGSFTIDARAGGAVAGHYRAERMGDEVDITLHPDGGRQPDPAQCGARLIITFVSLFRKWPATSIRRVRMDLSGERPPQAAAGQAVRPAEGTSLNHPPPLTLHHPYHPIHAILQK